MKLWQQFWNDESGAILSAEAALLGTVGIVGATVGLSAAGSAVNDELKDVAFAFRSLNQNYEFQGHRSEFAWTAGSSFTQAPIEESHRQLQEQIDRQEQALKNQHHELENRGPDNQAPKKPERKKKSENSVSVDSDWNIDGAASVPEPLPAPEL